MSWIFGYRDHLPRPVVDPPLLAPLPDGLRHRRGFSFLLGQRYREFILFQSVRPQEMQDVAHHVLRNEGCVYSVAFGTERGFLHYRNYSPGALDASGDAVSSGGGRLDRRAGGYNQFVDPDPSPDSQIDLQDAVRGSIVELSVPTLFQSQRALLKDRENITSLDTPVCF